MKSIQIRDGRYLVGRLEDRYPGIATYSYTDKLELAWKYKDVGDSLLDQRLTELKAEGAVALDLDNDGRLVARLPTFKVKSWSKMTCEDTYHVASMEAALRAHREHLVEIGAKPEDYNITSVEVVE